MYKFFLQQVPTLSLSKNDNISDQKYVSEITEIIAYNPRMKCKTFPKICLKIPE